tara:strand:+ start:275 stop:469 length:195 start_codon:yes stop_codon:yes gene_type:complete
MDIQLLMMEGAIAMGASVIAAAIRATALFSIVDFDLNGRVMNGKTVHHLFLNLTQKPFAGMPPR